MRQHAVLKASRSESARISGGSGTVCLGVVTMLAWWLLSAGRTVVADDTVRSWWSQTWAKGRRWLHQQPDSPKFTFCYLN